MRSRTRPMRIALLFLLLWLPPCVLSGAAHAAPAGHQVVVGDVKIDQNPDGSVTVIHASDGSIIQYDSFDILADELVEFIQPGADARVLNRVFGDATYIDGTLKANGIVYIVNPAGVFLDGGAVVDVGGLVAAAGHLSNEDFLAGIDHFELTGPVTNASQDVRGDLVALLGTRVENHGRIQAEDGVVALVAGERVVLSRLLGRVHVEVDGPAAAAGEAVGVVQAGRVETGRGLAIFAVGDHYSLALNHSGVTVGRDVELRGGEDGTVLVQGEIDASGDEGGRIKVTGDRIALVGATLDASGRDGGGRIRVGGGIRGEGRVPNAKRTFVDQDSVLRADATERGDGGSVVVWGDEAAVMQGSISARGGAQGGDGGFAEVSSLGWLEASGPVDLTAAAGRSGTFLLDPQDIVIMGGTADGSDDPDAADDVLETDDGLLGQVLFEDVGDGSEPFVIYESEIEETDANLLLEARNSVSVSGTFDNQVDAEGDDVVVVQNGNNLTIRTRNDVDDELGSVATPGIDLGALTWRMDGGGGIRLATGEGGGGVGESGADADITVGDVFTEGGAIQLTARNGSITTGNLQSSGLDGATGGAAGTIEVRTQVSGDVTLGDVLARGGEGLSGSGGNGGRFDLNVADGDVQVGAIDTSGGAAAGAGGGSAGSVLALIGSGGTGSMQLSGAVTAVDGSGTGDPVANGDVDLRARGGIEFTFVGQHIVTTENVRLVGGDVGAGNAIQIDAVGPTPDPAVETRSLQVSSDGTARVDVTTAGFDAFGVTARSNEADIEVTQQGVDTDDGIFIDLDGSPTTATLVRADMLDPDLPGGAELQLQLIDEFTGDDDVPLELEVASGALDGSNVVAIFAEDDILLQDDAIAMHPTGDHPFDGFLSLVADSGDEDGTGAIRAGGAGVAIDMNVEGTNPTENLFMVASEGVGTSGSPIGTANVEGLSGVAYEGGGFFVVNQAGGDVSLVADPRLEDFDRAPLPVPPDPQDQGDILPNDAVAVLGGDGDVEVTNQSGDLLLAGDVRIHDGGAGDVTLTVTDPDAAIAFRSSSTARVVAGGDALFEGPVLVTLDGEVVAGGDVTFTDAVDSNEVTLTTRNLSITSDGVVRFGGDVGSVFALRNLSVDGDVELTQDTSFTALQTADFRGNLDAAADDASGATIAAGDAVRFGGDVGAGGRLSGLSVDGEVVVFDGSADQSVVTGAGGVALNTNLPLSAPPQLATVGKRDGGLRLESVGGAVVMGENHKLTVDGVAELVGDSVQVADVNAQEIVVDSPDLVIQARAPGLVQVPGAGLLPDQGTELIATTISTTSAPTSSGSGPSPRFATLSGTVGGAGAGGLQVESLSRPVESADLVGGGDTFFDLGIGVADPGNEVEPDPRPVAPLLPGRVGSQEAADLAPGDAAVLAFLTCSEEASGDRPPRACAPAPGSALDSPRGEEIAERHRRLFGSSEQARAARRSLSGDTAAAGAARRDLAALLAQLRLLGMREDDYLRVRDRLLGEVGGDREALLSAVRAEAPGFPL